MMNAIIHVEQPKNETPLEYAPGSPERRRIAGRCKSSDGRRSISR
jgi:hypothetical protein